MYRVRNQALNLIGLEIIEMGESFDGLDELFYAESGFETYLE